MNRSHRVPFLPRLHENRSHMVKIFFLIKFFATHQSTSKLFTILQDPPASSISLPLTNPCPLREFIPSIKEVTTLDQSFITHDLQNHELDDGEHIQNTNATCKLSKSNNSSAVELVQTEKTDAPHCALTLDAMQGNQNYLRHVRVHVVDERFNG